MSENILIVTCQKFQWQHSLRSTYPSLMSMVQNYARSPSSTCVQMRQGLGATNAILSVSLHDQINLQLYCDMFQEKYFMRSFFHSTVNNHHRLLLLVQLLLWPCGSPLVDLHQHMACPYFHRSYNRHYSSICQQLRPNWG